MVFVITNTKVLNIQGMIIFFMLYSSQGRPVFLFSVEEIGMKKGDSFTCHPGFDLSGRINLLYSEKMIQMKYILLQKSMFKFIDH